MRTVVITGATGDLGHVVLPRLLPHFRCVALYRSEASFRKLAPHPNLHGIGRPEDAAQFAPIFAIVNLAGGFKIGASPADTEDMFETNVMPVVHAIDAIRPHLDRDGRIIAIASAAFREKRAGLAAYNASKGALAAYVDTLGNEGVRAHVLYPDTMDDTIRKNLAEEIARLLS